MLAIMGFHDGVTGGRANKLLSEAILSMNTNITAARSGTFCHRRGHRDQPSGLRRDAHHRPGIWGEPADRAEAIRTLQRLPELGVNFIDTADSYGPDVSEQLIREALHPYHGVLVATKGGLDAHRAGPMDAARAARVSDPAGAQELPATRRRADRTVAAASHRSARCRATSSSAQSGHCSMRASFVMPG